MPESSRREKPHRLPRDSYRGRVSVSLTLCIRDRRTPFVDSGLVKQFVDTLAHIAHQFRCIVPVYCFMPDRLHLILHGIDESAEAWKAVVRFKQLTGYWFARNRPQFEWQKDFFDRVLRNHHEMVTRVRYIVDNPVRGRLGTDWTAYPHTGSIGFDLREVLADIAS